MNSSALPFSLVGYGHRCLEYLEGMMGDYCKLIVSCTVKGEIRDELELAINELGLHDSAYQSQEIITSMEASRWNHGGDRLNLILIGQTKYGHGQDEFCEWLRPHVIQGSGENDVYAMSFSEYSDLPQVWKLTGNKE